MADDDRRRQQYACAERVELMQATMLRQVYSERQLFEMMVDFWSNHFNIYILKNQCRILKTWDDRG